MLYIVFVVLGLFLIRGSFYIVKVSGTSMFPTLNNGDFVLVWKYFPTKYIRSGQIIISQLSASEEQDDFLIKRVFGVAGDSVSTLSQPNVTDPLGCSNEVMQAGRPRRIWSIPAGHYFIKSDYIGFDSRMFGPLSYKSFRGLVIWNLSRRVKLFSPPDDLVEWALPAGLSLDK